MRARHPRKRKKTPTRHGASLAHRSHASNGRVVAIALFLLVIVCVAFGQTLGHEFVDYDDGDYVYENPNVTQGLTLRGVVWAFTHVHAANWHPLTTLSHMLDCQLYGLQPWGHHLSNVLLQAAAAILLFLALRRLTGNLWPSAFVAAVFAIHPLRVESVAWVSERKDVLSGVFFMLTLLAYARYARSARSSPGRYLTVVVLFALGLMCKPTLVTLPFVLLLLDYWPLGRFQKTEDRRQRTASKGQNSQGSSIGVTSAFQHFSVSAFETWSVVRGLVVEKIPLFVLSAASCVATVLAQEKVLEKSLKLTFLERAANAVVSYVAYLGQMFYPANLAVLYPYPVGKLALPEVLLAGLLLLIISVIVFLWRHKYPFLLVGWLWYLGMLVPMIGLLQVGAQARADRYTYLPLIGLYILTTWAVTELFAKWRRSRLILAIAALLIITVLAACTYRETSSWETSETLWKHAIDNTSNNYIAHYNLGVVFMRQSQSAAALAEFQKALQIKPDYADAEMNLGVVLQRSGDLNGAISHTQKALQIDPGSPEIQYNFGNLLLQMGEPDQAILHFQSALAARPDYAEAHNNLGAALAQEGKLDQAIVQFSEALRSKPDYAEAHTDLANALASQRKFNQAIPHYLEALRLNPNSPEAHYNLGDTLLQLGRHEEAVAHFTEALRLKPHYPEAEKQLRELGIPLPP